MQIIGRTFLLLLFFSLLSGCSPVISRNLLARVDSSLTFKEVLQNPDAYKGRIVLWGGKVIQVLPQDGTTFIEVLQMPLGWRRKPEEAYASEGKFLILVRKFLDFSQINRGKKITVAGEIQGVVKGEEIKSVTEGGYRYPVILCEEIHLWKEYLYPYSSSQPYLGPWWYDPSERPLRF